MPSRARFFFGTALTIFRLSSQHLKSVESELDRLREMAEEDLLPFGYDGTTEMCYCFNSRSGNDAVHWFSWEEGVTRPLNYSFQQWIEALPEKLFRNEIYAAYKKLTNLDAFLSVMEQRSAFKVRLLRFDRHLERAPDKPNDVLPRYNRVILEITKTRQVPLSILTVIILRLGSEIGDRNAEYLSFSVDDVPAGQTVVKECYVFDPFNLPFEKITVRFDPTIDLGSKMRIRFKELSMLLT